MQHTYSIVFQPNHEIVMQLKQYKNMLADRIGWFHSKNSLAHITIAEFNASDEQLPIFTKQLERIADSVDPFTVLLDHFSTYPNGALFIAPDLFSKEKLLPIMKRFNKETRFTLQHKSSDPHLSIARKLTEEQLQVAEEIFIDCHIEFECSHIVLRKLDLDTKQFINVNTFSFNSNKEFEVIQTSLF